MASHLVTGGNKGIGLAIVKGLLRTGAQVFLGSRDLARGEAARSKLAAAEQDRCIVVQLDVSSDQSVSTALKAVANKLGDAKLDSIVNNAGVAPGSFGWTGVDQFDLVVGVNYGGVVRTTTAFLPILKAEGGRVVMVSSGSAPMFVEKCSQKIQAKLMNPDASLKDISSFLNSFREIGERSNPTGTTEKQGASDQAFKEAGFSSSTYGASKAALNLLTMHFAKRYPKLKVNACSPGFVNTDLTAPIFKMHGKTADQMGAIAPADGAKTPLFLAIGDVKTPAGQGYYYGSDSKRSPLHKYRSPGDPEYTGSSFTVYKENKK